MHTVIIPKPIYHSLSALSALPQNSMKSQTAPKCASQGSSIVAKKPNGAFKLYKEKRIRIKERQKSESIEVLEKKQTYEKTTYKLKPKTLSGQFGENSTLIQRQTGHLFDYFDPNTAPAYVEQSNKQFYLKLNQQRLNESIEKKSLQIHQNTKVQNQIIKQSLHKQSENQFQMQLQQGRKDDTFIIYKKVHIKKTKKIRNHDQLPPDSKKSTCKKGEIKNNNQNKREGFLNEENKIIIIKQQQLIRQIEIPIFKTVSQHTLKHEEKPEQCKEVMITQKGSDRKPMKEFEMEDKIIVHNFILQMQLESSSEVEAQAFGNLDRKKVLTMIK